MRIPPHLRLGALLPFGMLGYLGQKGGAQLHVKIAGGARELGVHDAFDHVCRQTVHEARRHAREVVHQRTLAVERLNAGVRKDE